MDTSIQTYHLIVYYSCLLTFYMAEPLKRQYVSMEAVQSHIISLPVKPLLYIRLQEFMGHNGGSNLQNET